MKAQLPNDKTVRFRIGDEEQFALELNDGVGDPVLIPTRWKTCAITLSYRSLAANWLELAYKKLQDFFGETPDDVFPYRLRYDFWLTFDDGITLFTPERTAHLSTLSPLKEGTFACVTLDQELTAMRRSGVDIDNSLFPVDMIIVLAIEARLNPEQAKKLSSILCRPAPTYGLRLKIRQS